MSRLWTAQEIQDKAEWEGFDYFFNHYIPPSSIADKEIAEKVREYRRVRDELQQLVEEKADE